MKRIHIPNSTSRRPLSLAQLQENRNLIGRDLNHLPNATCAELPNLPSVIVKKLQTARRTPGILDNLLAADSHHEACELWQSFLNQFPSPSQKTINRALRILTAHKENRIN